MRCAEKDYYAEKLRLQIGNLRKTWAVLSTLINNKPIHNDITALKADGVTTTDPTIIANRLNDYFANIGITLASTITASSVTFNKFMNNNYPNSFAVNFTTTAEIINTVNNFKSKLSAGHDNIPTTILKASIVNIAYPLACIINNSIREGIFPDSQKIAKICPIYKSGDKTDTNNYRPISLLPVFSKIFETLISTRLTQYLHQNLILNPAQYGFRPKHSTYMALLDFYDKISSATDTNKYSIGIFIDLSKAFDTIDHEILLNKLSYYGVRGVALNWFRSYLSNRKQYVAINNTMSTISDISLGVPQGSVLGPLLFIIYINDIVNSSKLLSFILFADDTNLVYSHSDLLQLITTVNCELVKLDDWFKANKLSLNINKTHYILFGSKRKELPI